MGEILLRLKQPVLWEKAFTIIFFFCLASVLFPFDLNATEGGAEILQAYQRADYATAIKLLEEKIKRSEERGGGSDKTVYQDIYSNYILLGHIHAWKLGNLDKGLNAYEKAAKIRTSNEQMKGLFPVEGFLIADILERSGDLVGAKKYYLSILENPKKKGEKAYNELSALLRDELLQYLKYQIDGISLKSKDFRPLLPNLNLSSASARLIVAEFFVLMFVPQIEMATQMPGQEDLLKHIKQTDTQMEEMFLELSWIINASTGSVTPSSEKALEAFLMKYPDQYWSFLLGGAFYDFYRKNGQSDKADRLFNHLSKLAEKRGIDLVIPPDTSTATFPLGPYTGAVVDRITGEPVEGAAVLFYWTKQIPQLGHGRSELIDVRLVYTDQKGQYAIPKISPNLGLLGAVESIDVAIYQPGYQAYLLKSRYDDPNRRRESLFKEKGNSIMLERVPPGFDHKEHLEKIERTLKGIDPSSYRDRPEEHATSKDTRDIELDWRVAKKEFLRRLDWEKRRTLEGELP